MQRIIGRTLGLLDARERGGTERGEEEGKKGERGGSAERVLAKRSGVTHLKRSDADVRESLTCYVLISIPL